MAINDIVQTIAEARVDARSLSEFVFKPAGFKVTRRLAPTIDTLQFYVNSLSLAVTEAQGKVEYIETTVQDAINNTAIEGGVLADTFVTVTPNGVDTVARNQREVNSDYISVLGYHLPSVNPSHTEAFNKAIAAVSSLGGGVINIPRGIYDIDPAIGINLKSNIELRGGVGVKIRNTAHSLTSYRMLNIRDVENVIISGIELDGNRDNNSAVTGEHGMGVSVMSSSNIVVRDVISRNCWGDGFYVGRASDTYDIPSNVLFENVHAFNSRRQGLSVTSAKVLVVNDSSFNTSAGTSPECGIDFEPNYESDELSGIVFNNVTASGNTQGGLLFYLTKLTENSPRVDITINDYKCYDGSIGLSIAYQAISNAQGEITINNAKLYRSTKSPIVSVAFPNDSIDVQINNPTIINPFTKRESASEYNAAVTLGRGSRDWSAIAPNHTDDGGITINNLKVIDTREVSLTGHLAYIYNNFGTTSGMKIVDPHPAINLYAAAPFFIKKGAEVVDRDHNISSSNTLTTADKTIQAANYTYIDNGSTSSAARQLNVAITPTAADQNWVKEIVHTGTAGKIYVNLTSSGGVITPKKQIETGVGTGVFTTQEATTISSTVQGSRLRYKIMENGDMRIIEEVGTWVRA